MVPSPARQPPAQPPPALLQLRFAPHVYTPLTHPPQAYQSARARHDLPCCRCQQTTSTGQNFIIGFSVDCDDDDYVAVSAIQMQANITVPTGGKPSIDVVRGWARPAQLAALASRLPGRGPMP